MENGIHKVLFLILAKWNIDRKPRLEELMVQLNEKHKELVMLNSNVEQKLSIQAEKSDARSPAHLQVGVGERVEGVIVR
jgi:hypothetical protein